ncbi:MAG: NFACT family protein [Candidatus Aenigmarchaeota archaeon]|nr:NFACT family protein [Candidatus Aenigmarchaeota archaeon]
MAELKSLDFHFIIRELRESVLGGKFRKVYQYGTKSNKFLFEIYVSTKGNFWLYSDSEKMFLAQQKQQAPETPPNFCMFLRKHLAGATIKDIRQHGFDRIIEIETESSILIFEFVPPGNLILCDRFMNVIMPLSIQKWKDRDIVPKRPYRYPPENVNPYNISLETFRNIISKGDVVVSTVARMGFGSVYANEICALSDVEKNKPCSELSKAEAESLYSAIRNMGKRHLQPVTYEDGTVFPFPLITKKEAVKGKWSSFSAPLSEMFSEETKQVVQEQENKVVDEKKGKIERIIQRQKASVEKMKEKRLSEKEKADTIYRFYGTVEDILNGIQKAKAAGMTWSEIKERVKSEPTPEAESIVDINEHEGTVRVDLGGKEIELDFTKSVEENAAMHYEDSKKAKSKYEGAETAMSEKQTELGMIETMPPESTSPVKKKVRKPRRKWYEKFRWFISSKKFLLVAGKDATTNERLVKKHTDPTDWVFHTDIQGSAFVVVKTKAPRGTKFSGLKEGESVPPEVMKEASEIAAACSKAWSRGLASIDVYAVRPNQVSKTPPSGMNLPKGSFMIYGERQWFRDVETKIAIGVIVDRHLQKAEAISGPVMAIRTYCKYFVTIKPGDTPAPELARKVKESLIYKSTPEDRPLIEQINTDDFQKLIPSSSGVLVG